MGFATLNPSYELRPTGLKAMTARQFQSNRELFDYLVRLSDLLRSKGETHLADEVKRASQFALGVTPSEFFHEAQSALRSVRRKCIKEKNVLDKSELEQVLSAIQQIEIAFLEIGGA